MLISPHKEIAKILHTDEDRLNDAIICLEKTSKSKDLAKQIIAENDASIADRLMQLGVPRGASTRELYEALLSKVEADDYEIFSHLGNPDCKKQEDATRIAQTAKDIVSPPKGFFMKHEKAKELITKEPPKKIMDFLEYDSVDKMLEKEDLVEIMCALRFVEGSTWLNEHFFKHYVSLTPDDFEEREIDARGLSDRWTEKAMEFVRQKRHNLSHLKELGVVFITPASLDVSGQILLAFSLVMHYLYEIPFYSRIFKNISKRPETFNKNLISLLRGDVLEQYPGEYRDSAWLVIQRYLVKDDEFDWRLIIPHINPEAMHWANAEAHLSGAVQSSGLSKTLSFWRDTGWVGGYFRDEGGIDVLASFNLVDMVMSLVKGEEMSRQNYHQQEAMWNKIFISAFGRDSIYKYSEENLLKGYFEI